ncbi:Zn-dependent hydrolase [Aggregatilineales bacterium SYSU G02658]
MIPSTLKVNSNRMLAHFEELSMIGATALGGVARPALSNEDLRARTWLVERLEGYGFELRDDAVGNIGGILRSTTPQAKTLLVGSHLDTTLNGGKYDGSIGIIAGLECMLTVREAGIALPFHLEVIDFTDEEGSWQSLFGSMGLTGRLSDEHINDSKQDNAAFRAALLRLGLYASEVREARRDPTTLRGYLELHIEQGDLLDRTRTQIGIVTRVIGRSNFRVTFQGEAVHAATNCSRKRDALQGATCFMTKVYNLPTQCVGGMVNCGNVDVQPGITTIVPATATVHMEVRHPDPDQLAMMEQLVHDTAEQCAGAHGLSVQVRRTLHREVAHMDERLMQVVAEVCEQQQLSYTHMFSNAGHDAQIMAGFTPSALIFIPCKDGISMNPKEYTDWENVENGANVLLHTILRLAMD